MVIKPITLLIPTFLSIQNIVGINYKNGGNDQCPDYYILKSVLNIINFNIDLPFIFTEISQMKFYLFTFTSHVLKIHNVSKLLIFAFKTNG